MKRVREGSDQGEALKPKPGMYKKVDDPIADYWFECGCRIGDAEHPDGRFLYQPCHAHRLRRLDDQKTLILSGPVCFALPPTARRAG